MSNCDSTAYGANEIEIPGQTIFVIIWQEYTTPFYVSTICIPLSQFWPLKFEKIHKV